MEKLFLLLILLLMTSCTSIKFYSKEDRDFLSTCTSNLKQSYYVNSGDTRESVYAKIGMPVHVFEGVDRVSGEAVVVEEYRKLSTYTIKSQIFKNQYGTYDEYERKACNLFRVVYAKGGNIVKSTSWREKKFG